MTDEMQEAHTRDYRALRVIDAARGPVSDVLTEASEQFSPREIDILISALRHLEMASARIVRRWD